MQYLIVGVLLRRKLLRFALSKSVSFTQDGPYLSYVDFRMIFRICCRVLLKFVCSISQFTQPLFNGILQAQISSFFLPEMPGLFDAVPREWGLRLLLMLRGPFLQSLV